ncbi:MAG: response regulator [Deltaproteobacteria bacterium]|nr:response regulator [Deltaproteobacteria bacterium]
MDTILVVDDDELVADLLRAVLERAGMRVVVHTSGFGLAVAVRKHRPALVVLDVNMPGLSGVQAVRAMRALDPAYGIDAPLLPAQRAAPRGARRARTADRRARVAAQARARGRDRRGRASGARPAARRGRREHHARTVNAATDVGCTRSRIAAVPDGRDS